MRSYILTTSVLLVACATGQILVPVQRPCRDGKLCLLSDISGAMGTMAFFLLLLYPSSGKRVHNVAYTNVQKSSLNVTFFCTVLIFIKL